ncbi:hypothetical protein SCHPADRAFT_997109 [Schizopora paradoxa]|uniref:DUF6534 domain-containing protein n=1 Tax=Schizopora paradoxa TaxID=27342 RepID=A0A0H2RPJ1_9AGAM|nr:hypothetical protein SCHPADRAFT_997109 [Schizopora paradoxa]
MTVIDTTAGAVFIALVLSAILFGVTVSQAVHFFQRCGSDNWLTILSVVVLLILDVALMPLAAYSSYVYVIGAIGDITELLRVPPTATQLIMISLSTVNFVRGFFIYRIWFLSNRSKVVLAFNCFLLFGAYGLGLYACAKILPIRSTPDLANLSWEIYSILCPGMIADSWIASMLCYYLFRSRNEFRSKTNSLVNKLAAYAINTGLLTVLWDICTVVTYARANHTLLFFVFFLSISKLYTNALLASLNSRQGARAQLRGVEYSTFRAAETRQLSRSGPGLSIVHDLESQSPVTTVDMHMPSFATTDSRSVTSSPAELKSVTIDSKGVAPAYALSDSDSSTSENIPHEVL